jgi:phosphonopyruvate decarboxylase
MITPKHFFDLMHEHKLLFFAGVPDSLLKNLCAYIDDNVSTEMHIICANEGSAIALGAGHYLGTGNIPVVYMQNSGLGNSVNPLTSLTDQDVYSIPVLLIIGHRGKQGTPDEPQHVKMGKISLPLLDCLSIPYAVLGADTKNTTDIIGDAVKYMHQNKSPYAIVVEPGTFENYNNSIKSMTGQIELTRKEAITFCANALPSDAAIVSTTGHISRELYQYRINTNIEDIKKDFKVVGSMGHANMIALGTAQNTNKEIYCFDGDGASIMHLGNMAIIGQKAPKNYKHIIFNNGAHVSVGGQSTVGHQIDLSLIAKACGYKSIFKVSTLKELKTAWEQFKHLDGPILLEVLTNIQAESDLPRPEKCPNESKEMFMDYLK